MSYTSQEYVSQLGASLQWHGHKGECAHAPKGCVTVCNCGNSLYDHKKARGALATHKTLRPCNMASIQVNLGLTALGFTPHLHYFRE